MQNRDRIITVFAGIGVNLPKHRRQTLYLVQNGNIPADTAPRSLRTEIISRLEESGRSERIRTSDPLYPKQVRYQAAPHPAMDPSFKTGSGG